MKKTSETIVFFGSGPVAASSLDHLAKNFLVEAIVTKPSTEKMMAQAAPSVGIYTVTNKQNLVDLFAKRPFKSRLGIIVDFGIIVPKQIIDYFKLGIINSHFSLLPQWRGADPITFAVLSGQKTTGVSLMLIAEGLDEGELLAQQKLSVSDSITTPQLTQKLINISNEMLVKYVPRYFAGKLKPYPQDETQATTYSRKLTKEDGRIDWHKSAADIEREIRAFAGWPRSYTNLAGKQVIIAKASLLDYVGAPGSVSIIGKALVISCSDKSLKIEKLQPAGKKEMTGEAFIAGHKHLLV